MSVVTRVQATIQIDLDQRLPRSAAECQKICESIMHALQHLEYPVVEITVMSGSMVIQEVELNDE